MDDNTLNEVVETMDETTDEILVENADESNIESSTDDGEIENVGEDILTDTKAKTTEYWWELAGRITISYKDEIHYLQAYESMTTEETEAYVKFYIATLEKGE